MPRRKKGLDSGGGRGSGKSSIVLNSKGKPQQRNAANARERARMRVLSRAFCRLKTTLPWVPADTKLSKLDTLRLAASYIAHLKGILRDDSFNSSDETASHPSMSLTWPFGFNRPTTISGGNGSSIGGGSEADESVEGSSSCWEPEPESPTKDCIHLDHPDQTDLLVSGKHLQMHFDETRSDLHGKLQDDLPNSGISTNLLNNNHILSYNYHQEHQHHHNLQHHPTNPSSVPYGFQQSDMILSIS